MSSNAAIPAPSDSAYIPTLDGWRAVAVLMVIGSHAITYIRESHWPGSEIAIRALGHGGVGVDIFFALSGYLISTLLLREKERSGGIRLGSFYLRRVFRILPPIVVYLAGLMVMRELGWVGSVIDRELVASLFFFRNYMEDGSWYSSHFWSLAVEEHFYLIIPWVLLAFTHRRAAQLLAALALACIAARWGFHEWHLNLEVNPEFRTENRVDALMWGAFLAVILRADQTREWLRRHLTLPRLLAIGLVAAALMVLWPSMPLRRTLVALVLPLLIIFTVLHPRHWASRPLEWDAVRWLGHRSYALYIWQMLFFVDLPQRDMPLVQTLPIALIASLACAAISYRLVEQPMVRMGHRLTARPVARAQFQ